MAEIVRIEAPADRDAWQRVLERAAAGDTQPTGRGRVLKVKLGYNPNSSSVGSVVSILLWTAAFSSIALNLVAALVRRHAADGPGEPHGAPASQAPPTAEASPARDVGDAAP